MITRNRSASHEGDVRTRWSWAAGGAPFGRVATAGVLALLFGSASAQVSEIQRQDPVLSEEGCTSQEGYYDEPAFHTSVLAADDVYAPGARVASVFWWGHWVYQSDGFPVESFWIRFFSGEPGGEPGEEIYSFHTDEHDWGLYDEPSYLMWYTVTLPEPITLPDEPVFLSIQARDRIGWWSWHDGLGNGIQAWLRCLFGSDCLGDYDWSAWSETCEWTSRTFEPAFVLLGWRPAVPVLESSWGAIKDMYR